MSARQQPRLMRSGLTGRVYVVTRYRDLGDDNVEATQKYDVTEDFEDIVSQYLSDLADPPSTDVEATP